MTGSVPPPGWYPDPANEQQLRWWTGERWTGAARPLGDPPADAGAASGLALGAGEGGGARDVHEAAPNGDPALTPSDDRAAGDVTSPADRWTASTSAADGTAAVTAPSAASGSPPGTGHRTALADDEWGIPAAAAAPVEGGWTRERMIAAWVMGGLVALSLGIWLIAVVLTGSGNGSSPDAGTAGAASDTEGAAETEDAEAAPDDDASAEAPPEDDVGDGDDDGDAADGDGEGDGDEEPEEDLERTVDFDGACQVELDEDQLAADTPLRPWQFEECVGAPIDLSGGDGPWIVVIASMDGELDVAAARERAADHGSDYGVLWSTHYPSLNPGWWVVFDGPFSDEDDATDSADDAGGGAYPRLLSDDEDDRYCIADDGC